MMDKTRGRIVSIERDHLILRNQKGTLRVPVESSSSAQVGDLVEIQNGTLKQLTPNRTQGKTMKWMEKVLDPRRVHALDIRFRVEAGIRDFFLSRDFRETRTPLLVPCPGMEPHIRPFGVKSTQTPLETLDYYLPTSPEFAMKRLLVGGLERIFQICPAFRDEPKSITHRPEFTMLEWYRAFANDEDIRKDTEQLFDFLANQLFGESSIPYQGKKISVKPPWPRLRVRDLFQERAGIDLTQRTHVDQLVEDCRRLGIPANSQETLENWDDLYFKIWLNRIEPHLPADQAVFVTRYPASQAALSVIDSDADGSLWAKRFELYAGGLELGNAFEELTDPDEQRRRFEKDMDLRTLIYGPSFPKNPLDEEFLQALQEGMPPSGGIAVGVDRMIMLFADEPDVHFTFY